MNDLVGPGPDCEARRGPPPPWASLRMRCELVDIACRVLSARAEGGGTPGGPTHPAGECAADRPAVPGGGT